MITMNGRQKSDNNKEEKMNARKVLLAVCVLVIGLWPVCPLVGLAAPPTVEYRPGVNAIYRGYGYNVSPKVSVTSYKLSRSTLPSFYPGWISKGSAKEKPWQPHPGLMSQMYVVPEVHVPQY